MKLGILKTGSPPSPLADHGSYPAMFRRLLGEGAHDYAEYDAENGHLPTGIDACSAYLITGSASDAYDRAPWIVDLIGFLRAAQGQAALVGICFGHQVMAEAFGGKVEKSARGWGIGNHTYAIAQPRPWLGDRTAITLPASHQDQVVALPPRAQVIGGSAFCPYGLIAYGDGSAISMQLHPEFDTDYAVALTETKRGHGPSDADIADALASARQPNDRALVAAGINRFLAGL